VNPHEFSLTPDDQELFPCSIESFLDKKMKIHQKEGVKFMFECVTGLKGNDIQGCILADSMGLGKTL
jgi:SNF2 family DNA or RNA helicase